MADNAKACPACGWRPTSRFTKGFAILMFLGLGFGFYNTAMHPESSASGGDDLWQKHGAIAVAATKVWRDNLKDPDSAKVRSALLMPSGAWCFDLSAKNSFGANVRSFMLISPNGAPQFADADSPSDTFRTEWNSYCSGKGNEYANVVQASI